MKYFRLLDNVYYPDRWYLGDITPDDDNWKYIYGVKIDKHQVNKYLEVNIYQNGCPMDFTMSVGYLVPIVSEAIKQTLMFVDNLQFFPVNIAGIQYYIMVICAIINCIDESKSDFDRFTEEDMVIPEKIGRYRSFYKMKIDENKMEAKHIGRPAGFEIAIIVSEKVKIAIENINPLTARFKEV